MISAVYEHNDGYKFEERYGDKGSFRRAVKKLKNARFLHAADYDAGIAIYWTNLWGYLNEA